MVAASFGQMVDELGENGSGASGSSVGGAF